MVAKSIGAALIDILGIKTTVPCNFDKVQHTAGLTFNSNVQHATYNMQRTACNAQHATCNAQHATCSMQHTQLRHPLRKGRTTAAHERAPPVRTAERVSPSVIAVNLCRANRWLPWHRWMLCYLAIASKSPHDLASCEDEPHMDSKTRL